MTRSIREQGNLRRVTLRLSSTGAFDERSDQACRAASWWAGAVFVDAAREVT